MVPSSIYPKVAILGCRLVLFLPHPRRERLPPWPLFYDSEEPGWLLPHPSHQTTRRFPYLRPCGPFGLLHPKCGSSPTNHRRARLDRAAFPSSFFPGFPSESSGGAGLGHFSPGAGHVFCFL